MSEKEKFYLTKEGLEKMKKQCQLLQELRSSKIKEGVPRILHSEELNPEYLSFREDSNLLELKIAELKNILKNARLINLPAEKNQGVIAMGARVLVKLAGRANEFQVVGTLEADPLKNRISDESPIGQVLLGRKAGDVVTIKMSQNSYPCQIIKVKYDKI